jgi:hypothetical protein
LSVAVSFAEILDDFRGAGARLAEGDPAVLPERELLALQEYLDIAVARRSFSMQCPIASSAAASPAVS